MIVSSEHTRKERIDRGIKVRSDSLYALMSWRELSYLTLPRLVLIAGMLALPLVLPGAYWQKVITITCIYALLALSFDFLAHFLGLVSLGGAFFIGGGRVSVGPLEHLFRMAAVGRHPRRDDSRCRLLYDYPAPVPAPAGGLFRHRDTHVPPVHDPCHRGTGYPRGYRRHHGHRRLFQFPDRTVLHESCWSMVFLFAVRRVVNEDLGLVFRAVKDNDQAVKASGMSITYYKAIAVFIASIMGCLGGACLVHIYMWAGMSLFALDFSIIPIAATVIGGGGTLIGPVLGCLILVPISELLREFGTLRVVFYSCILVGFIVFRVRG